ncbi:MAG: F0F1 ATP synthase subunit A [Micrococcaceae bacterium]
MHLRALIPWGAQEGFSKQMLLMICSTIIIAVFFVMASKKEEVVPSKLQYTGEMGYNFVRNDIARDIIGSKDFKRYVPLLFTFFWFILVNNVYGMIPLLQLPTFSHVGSAYVLAAVAYVVWVGAGIKRHGFIGFFKHMCVPGGVKGPILGLVVPIEFFSNILVRPVTHALRLFATMFAGHLVVMVFASGAEFLIMQYGGIVGFGGGIISIILGIAMYFLEALIMVLQAYVFTLLMASYLQGALADEH